MHKSLSSKGSLDHTRSPRGAAGKFSSMPSSDSTTGGGESLKFSHLYTTKCSGDSTGLCFVVDGEAGIIDFW